MFLEYLRKHKSWKSKNSNTFIDFRDCKGKRPRLKAEEKAPSVEEKGRKNLKLGAGSKRSKKANVNLEKLTKVDLWCVSKKWERKSCVILKLIFFNFKLMLKLEETRKGIQLNEWCVRRGKFDWDVHTRKKNYLNQ